MAAMRLLAPARRDRPATGFPLLPNRFRSSANSFDKTANSLPGETPSGRPDNRPNLSATTRDLSMLR
jgi:hypothetical protein